MTTLDRRQVLVASAAAAGAVTLAACGSAASTTPASSAASPTAAPTGPPNSSPAGSSSPPPNGMGVVIASTAEVPVGGGVIVESGGQKFAVAQPTAGSFTCFSAVCPHQGCNCNAVADGTIDCPCHGSRFAITDGAVVQGPAKTGLAAATIEVSGQEIKLLA